VAAIFAAKAEKNSRPVSNGFAPEVIRDLRELRSLFIEHLNNHTKG
jgi:ERCC4-type nuclease